MKYQIIVSDPPWAFGDKLTMSDVPRGAAANYDVLDNEIIKNLDVEKIASKDALLALWVPSSLLQEGLDTMKAWGFEQKQTFVWVKVKKNPLSVLKSGLADNASRHFLDKAKEFIKEFSLNDVLAFGMGRLFRQTHEICLLGTRGKIYDKLKNKSQRSVLMDVNLKHSAKPEGLQDRLELMFPSTKRLEMFARRERKGWTCVGYECPSTLNEDIRDSIKRLSSK